jgi:porin
VLRNAGAFIRKAACSTQPSHGSHAAAIDDETGVELFYNAKITPWFDISANIQAIDPALSASDTAVFAGLRATIRF